jgi:hypothetical protein
VTRTRFCSIAVLLLALPSPALPQASATRIPVLVELFTSEGCSSCPPADKLLAALEKEQPVPNANIIVLEEHVDYWDRQGWRDRFSSSQFTQRQNFYAPRLNFDDAYTPQMVVDGHSQFLGSDSSKALSAIRQAVEAPKIELSLSAPAIVGRQVSSSVAATPTGPALPHGDLYAVLVDPSASSEVKAGENGGRQLNHVSIARSFQRIGKLQDLGRGPIPFKISAPSDTAPDRMRLIVFAQLPDQGAVRGVTQVETMPKP